MTNDPSLAPDTDKSLSDLAVNASVVDTILDLDDFLSGEVRRATQRVPFSTAPDLEADLHELEHELAGLIDQYGRPLPDEDGSLASGGRTHVTVMADYARVQAAYNASRRYIEVEALGTDAFADFRRDHPALDDTEETDAKVAAVDALVIACARRPKFTDETLTQFRERVGLPVMRDLTEAVWYVNTRAGVSVPKSPVFSLAQRQQARSES